MRRYGQWSGNPQGQAGDPERCEYAVWSDHRERQCSRKRGHGEGGRYCRQHAAAMERSAEIDREIEERYGKRS